MAKTPKKTDEETIYGGNADGPSDAAKSGAPMSDDGSKLKQEATPKAVHSGAVPLKVAGESSDIIALVKEALSLNILVDDKWDANRLRAEIQMAREGRADLQVKGAIPPSDMGAVDYDEATKGSKTPVMLERAYWDAGGNRLEPGTAIHVSKKEDERLIGQGVARRNDPLPG